MKTKILILFMLVSMQISAQILEPIKWNITEHKISESSLEVRYKATIEEGWHLYSNILPEDGPLATEVKYTTLQGVQAVGELTTDVKATEEYVELFSMVLGIFEGEVTFSQKFNLLSPDYKIEGGIKFMGCNNQTCLTPTTQNFQFVSVQPVVVDDEDIFEQEVVETKSWTPVVEELDSVERIEEKRSNMYIFLASFLGGLLALLTPCVWPMIPMTVSFFLKHSGGRREAVWKAMMYGVAIIVVYLVLGLLITTIFGASALNSLSTNAWFNVFFFLLLVLFAASFFGAFDLTLPASWTTKLDAKADATSGFLSVLLMAFTLALVSFSCTGPIIGTLLVEAAASGITLGPAIGMFGFSLALAIPFVLFAIFPTLIKSLPKSGSWLNSVKVVLAFIELALALKFLSVADLAYGWGILPRELFLAIWIVIFFLLGLYLLGFIRFKHDGEVKHVSVTRLILAVASLSFSVYMLPGLWGAPLKSISAFAPPMSTQVFNLSPQTNSVVFDDYDEAQAYAKEHNKPIFVDFTGYGCVNCRKMEASVFVDDRVKEILDKEYVVVTLHVDDKTSLPEPLTVEEYGKNVTLETYGDKWSYLQRYKFGANAQPYYVLLSPSGKPLASPYGYNEDIEKFIEFLNKGLGGV